MNSASKKHLKNKNANSLVRGNVVDSFGLIVITTAPAN